MKFITWKQWKWCWLYCWVALMIICNDNALSGTILYMFFWANMGNLYSNCVYWHNELVHWINSLSSDKNCLRNCLEDSIMKCLSGSISLSLDTLCFFIYPSEYRFKFHKNKFNSQHNMLMISCGIYSSNRIQHIYVNRVHITNNQSIFHWRFSPFIERLKNFVH